MQVRENEVEMLAQASTDGASIDGSRCETYIIFIFLVATRILRGSNLQPPKRGAWLGIFQQNWQSHKIAMSSTAKYRIDTKVLRVFEQRRRLRE